MYSNIQPPTPLSNNNYVKKEQLTTHIKYLRDVLQNQKFSNELTYPNRQLIDSINHFKKLLNKTNKEIMEFEQTSFSFGNSFITPR